MENEQIQLNEKAQIFGFNIPLEIYDFFKTAGMVLVFCGLIYLFIATPNQVEGDSMLPALANNELIITDKIDQLLSKLSGNLGMKYTRGDIIVFQKPGHKDFVKRIIGLPGEEISIHDGHVIINKKELEEDYLVDVYTIGGDFVANDSIVIIPENRYFVLGDNRLDSLDSRYSEIGLINKDWIKGKVIARYWPFTRFSLFNNKNYNL